MKTESLNTTTSATTKRHVGILKHIVFKAFTHVENCFSLRKDHVWKSMLRPMIFVFAFILMSSCKKDDDPAMNLQNVTAPVLLTPNSGENIILTEESAADTFPEFSWTATQYNFNRPLANTTYSLQMDIDKGDFADYTTLTNTNDLRFSMINQAVNTRLLLQDLVAGEPHTVYFRVGSFIVALGGDETRYSNVVTCDITPYESVVSYPPIYLLGDATTVGWDANNPIETPYQKDGVFSVIQTLKANAYYKFIANVGNWAPQWGTDASGTWEGGKLVYRVNESEPDPSAIPSPPVEGLYQISIDTLNLIYSVSVSDK